MRDSVSIISQHLGALEESQEHCEATVTRKEINAQARQTPGET